MGILFISHSSRDNEAAIRLRNWLKVYGWGEVFLDLDPNQGLAPGQQWQQELKLAGERCSGVVLALSPSWIASPWCQTEFLLADQLGKKIFPVFVAATPFEDLPYGLKTKFQTVDISDPEKEADGLERLAIGLKRAGLHPADFEWPPADNPKRPIYRGLQSLDETDAAIFFGRDAQITKGLDALRRMRDGAPERLLVILGASGAGKSSFLKAGLLARLKRDEENFVVLPVIRPGQAVLTGAQGLASALASAPEGFRRPEDVRNAIEERRGVVMERLKRFAASALEHHTTRPPTIVLPIDQAEELFAAESREAVTLFDLLVPALMDDGNSLVVATIRTDSFSKMQDDARLGVLPRLPFDLSPIPHGGFKDVIEGPARRSDPPLSIEPALTEQLLKDLADDDALPLLAFTLERLHYRSGGTGRLILSDYTEEMGGLPGAIAAAVDAAFSKAVQTDSLPKTREELEQLARMLFIPWLVQIDAADEEPRRRCERLDRLPADVRPLAARFVDERLLTCDRRIVDGVSTDIVEVAHEAILRQWPALRAWIAVERDALRAMDAVRTAAGEWHKHGNARGERRGWLAHRGARLREAETLFARSDFAAGFGQNDVAYIAACRSIENAEIEREREGLVRTKRLQQRIGMLIAAAAVLVVIGAFGIVQLLARITAGAAETLIAEAAGRSAAGDYGSAERLSVAAMNAAIFPEREDSETAAAELRGANIASAAVAVLRHSGLVLNAGFSPDGRRIVTALQGGTAELWDVASGARLRVLRGHQRAVESAVFNADGKRIVTASTDGTARVWEVATGRTVSVLRGHIAGISSAVFSPDGRQILTASRDRSARLWSAASGRLAAILKGHDDQLEDAAFSPDGSRAVTASDDGTARVWNLRTFATMLVLRGHESAVYSARFSPDGKRIVTSSSDRTVRVWDAATGNPLHVLRGHTDVVATAAFSPDGADILSASYDRTVRIWDAGSGLAIILLRGHEGPVNGAAFSTDGLHIVTASDDRTARVWETAFSRHVIVLRGHGDSVISAGFSPDGRHVVTASSDRSIRIWDAAKGRELSVIRGHQDVIEAVSFSPDGHQILTGSDDNTARLWNAATGSELAVLSGHGDHVNGATFSGDGRRIVTASNDGTARIWDPENARTIRILGSRGQALGNAAFSPDGTRVVTASSNNTATIWDTESGRPIAVLKGHRSSVMDAKFSPDGAKVVTAGGDRTIWTWDAGSGNPLVALTGHQEAVVSAAFSPDGKRIVSASRDATARLWDATTGVQIAILRGHDGPVWSAAFSQDGTRIVTASDDGTARVWNIASLVALTGQALERQVCHTMSNNGLSTLSASELQGAPILAIGLSPDACATPGVMERLVRIFRFAGE